MTNYTHLCEGLAAGCHSKKYWYLFGRDSYFCTAKMSFFGGWSIWQTWDKGQRQAESKRQNITDKKTFNGVRGLIWGRPGFFWGGEREVRCPMIGGDTPNLEVQVELWFWRSGKRSFRPTRASFTSQMYHGKYISRYAHISTCFTFMFCKMFISWLLLLKRKVRPAKHVDLQHHLWTWN